MFPLIVPCGHRERAPTRSTIRRVPSLCSHGTSFSRSELPNEPTSLRLLLTRRKPPLFQVAAESSGCDARALVGNASEASSIRTNPFIRRDAELRELGVPGLQKAPPSNSKDKFVRPHLSLPRKNLGRSLTNPGDSYSNDDDNAASEWETIAPAEELGEISKRRESSGKALKRKRNLDSVFQAHQALNNSLSSSPSGLRRNTILGPPDISLPKLPSGTSHPHLPGYTSFPSSSSCYTDIDGQDADTEQQLLDPECWGLGRCISQRRPATLGGEGHLQIPARSISKASSSTKSDPFIYDGGPYSAFLQPAAEREVSSALARAGLSHTSSLGIAHRGHHYDFGLPVSHDRGPTAFYDQAAIRST